VHFYLDEDHRFELTDRYAFNGFKNSILQEFCALFDEYFYEKMKELVEYNGGKIRLMQADFVFEKEEDNERFGQDIKVYHV
jgi:hypothetical protein